MRFKIVGVEGECLDCLCVDYDEGNPDYPALLNYEGGEVVTADEHDALIAALEDEIERVCKELCQWCDQTWAGSDRFMPAKRGDDGSWSHNFYQNCSASALQERRFQRNQSKK